MGQEGSQLVDEKIQPHTLKSRSIASVAELIKDGKAKKIVVLTGAGISTSAGIPDFRSPDTGLYANLARLNLPYAEAVFDISYFRNHPEPFVSSSSNLKSAVLTKYLVRSSGRALSRKVLSNYLSCFHRIAA